MKKIVSLFYDEKTQGIMVVAIMLAAIITLTLIFY